MSKWRFVVLSVPLFALPCAAQDVPPPPKPNDNGPTLSETMKFIQDKMNVQGNVTFTVSNESRSDTYFWQMSGVIADPTSCTFTANANPDQVIDTSYEIEDPTDGYQTVSASFRDIAAISVQSYVDWVQANWRQGMQWHVAPPLFLLETKADGAVFKTHWVVLNPKILKHIDESEHLRKKLQDQSVPEMAFLFRDEDMANRVAKAMLHAVELCGGGSKPEPF